MKARAEWFGAIVAVDRPAMLISVNRPLARLLGVRGRARWTGPRPRHLSAPTEVHVVLSRRCRAGCRSCYVDATADGAALTFAQARTVLERLASRGVFHVALGGGEVSDVDFLPELAVYARTLGLVPNLTTNGLALSDAFLSGSGAFGQINVSVDGLADAYAATRGHDSYGAAERGLRRLRAVKREVGINCVVTRHTFDRLAQVAARVARLKLRDLELLRFKPAGRGRQNFQEEDLTPDQARALYPLVRRLALRYRIRIKLDCSFTPLVFWHRPSLRAARFFGVVGCEGGNLLASVLPDGAMTGCSFGGPTEADIFAADGGAQAWAQGFAAFRSHAEQAVEPCRSCRYLSLCKGGCHVVAQAAGDWWAPDPGCPSVQDAK